MNKEVKDKTVYVRLTPDMDKWVQDKIQSGEYKNASQVINAVLRKEMILGQ
ncbi:type II toxin-antitoxin system ParD family antitoxin [Klebsiella aerogenes]